MIVALKPIDSANWYAVTKLAVASEQAGYVAPNVYSIAQSKVEPW